MDSDKLILFDFDGTVIDGSEGIFNCINYSTDKLALPRLPEETLRRFVGPSLFDSYKNYCGVSDENAEKLIEYYRERYAPIGYAECVLYPGIKELLIRLNSYGFTVGVASSKPLEFVCKIARQLGVYELFSIYSCPDFSSHDSGKAQLILDAVKISKQKKESTVMIGDRHFDIEAAKAAGVVSVGVSYGFAQEGELERAGADFIAESTGDICEYLTGMIL